MGSRLPARISVTVLHTLEEIRLKSRTGMFHLLSQFPAHALNAILLGSQTVYCLITGSIPVLGGAVLRAQRPGFYALIISLMTGGFGLQLFGVHF